MLQSKSDAIPAYDFLQIIAGMTRTIDRLFLSEMRKIRVIGPAFGRGWYGTVCAPASAAAGTQFPRPEQHKLAAGVVSN